MATSPAPEASTPGPEMAIPMLNCGVCRSMFRQPRILSCLHTFCHPCLYELPEVCSSDNQSFIRCPQCHKPTFLPERGISGLVHNDFLSRMCQDYVNEVQRTLGGTRAIGSGGSSPSQGPASPASYSRGQFGSSQGNYSSRLVEGTQSPKSPRGAAFTYDFHRESAASSSSTSSSEAYQQAGRRPSVERIPLRARQRKLSMTPPEVLRIWEGLQRKLNHLQSASVQITYGLENINLAETNWYQRKQDLRREVQRRSAQLQFFIKRQERLLLAMLDSKDTDDSFIKVADQARNGMRSNLKAVVHEAEVVKSVLDLAEDTELLTLGSLLLGNTASQHPVSMEVPELHFKMPDELSVEDKMGEDFGCFSSTAVQQDIYTPEILELEVVEVDDSVKRKIVEDNEKETVVTETYTTYVPPPPPVPDESTSVTSSETFERVTELNPQPEIKEEEPEEEEEEEEESEEEEEEEEESSEEEMIVEETIEIINGKMTVVSSSRKPAPKEEKKPKPQREKRPKKKVKKTDDTKLTKPVEPRMPSPRGRDTHTRRTVNSAAASSSSSSSSSSFSSNTRTEQPPAPASAFTFQQPAVPYTQQTGRPPESSVSSSPTGLSQSRETTSKSSEASSRPTSLSFGASRYSSHSEARSVPARKTGRVEDKPLAETTSPKDSGTRTPSEEHQSTLSKFQNFRETLKQKRRELLGVSIGSGHPGISSILARERRVQSLDRRASLREMIHHPLSPDTEDKPGLPGDVAHLTQASTESGEPDDPQADSTSADKDPDSPGASADKKSRPVRRAVSAASDKATKMEFLRETWKKRKELLIQTDAYITSGAGAESKEAEKEEKERMTESVSSPDDSHRSRASRKARSRLTDVSQALTGNSADSGMEPVLQHDIQEDYLAGAPSSTSAAAESLAEAQAMKTVDKILQKKNVPVLSPRSPTQPTSPTSQPPPPPWLTKPSMVVRPRPRESTTTTTSSTSSTSSSAATSFVPTQLETLQEDETKASPEQKRGLRTTSPSRAEGSADTLQQVRASIRRKKERWRSLSLT